MTLLEREINEQPDVIGHLIDSQMDVACELAEVIDNRDIRYILLAARGSSDNAGRYAQYLFGAMNGLPVALATPSLFTLYRQPPRLRDVLVIGISQSGQGPDVMKVIREGREQGALTLAITNQADSPLVQAAELALVLEAGEEKSLAATKTYTAQLAALALLSAALSGDSQRMEALQRIGDVVRNTLAETDAPSQRAAERWLHAEHGVVIGRGYNYATAFEIALKLTEVTYLLIQPYSSADFHHGPLALVEANLPAIVVAMSGPVFPDLLDLLKNMRERGADLLVISDQEGALEQGTVQFALPSDIPEWLTPIIAVIPGQLMALRLAEARGFDPDKPRSLRKVTKTL